MCIDFLSVPTPLLLSCAAPLLLKPATKFAAAGGQPDGAWEPQPQPQPAALPPLDALPGIDDEDPLQWFLTKPTLAMEFLSSPSSVALDALPLLGAE